MSVEIRTHFSETREKKGITFKEPSLTKQANKDECDINKIMAKYNLTGQLDHVKSMQPVYGDATVFGDGYRSALALVEKAKVAFGALPSELRIELGQNPAALEGFMMNPANKDKCIKYGLFEPEVNAVNVVEKQPEPSSGE